MANLVYEDAGTLAQAEFNKRLEAKIINASEAERFYFFDKLYRFMRNTNIVDNSGYESLALQAAKEAARKINADNLVQQEAV